MSWQLNDKCDSTLKLLEREKAILPWKVIEWHHVPQWSHLSVIVFSLQNRSHCHNELSLGWFLAKSKENNSKSLPMGTVGSRMPARFSCSRRCARCINGAISFKLSNRTFLHFEISLRGSWGGGEEVLRSGGMAISDGIGLWKTLEEKWMLFIFHIFRWVWSRMHTLIRMWMGADADMDMLYSFSQWCVL